MKPNTMAPRSAFCQEMYHPTTKLATKAAKKVMEKRRPICSGSVVNRIAISVVKNVLAVKNTDPSTKIWTKASGKFRLFLKSSW